MIQPIYLQGPDGEVTVGGSKNNLRRRVRKTRQNGEPVTISHLYVEEDCIQVFSPEIVNRFGSAGGLANNCQPAIRSQQSLHLKARPRFVINNQCVHDTPTTRGSTSSAVTSPGSVIRKLRAAFRP